MEQACQYLGVDIWVLLLSSWNSVILPEKPLWISLKGTSSCLHRRSGASCQSWSLCISQNDCCCHSWLSLHFQLPDRKSPCWNFHNDMRRLALNYTLTDTVLKHCPLYKRILVCCESGAPAPLTSYLCYWIGCQDFVFNSRLTSRFAYNSKVPHSISSRHCFTSSRFTTDDDRLVLAVSDF